MATRLYFTNSTAPYTPTTAFRGAWDSSTSSVTKLLGATPGGTATTIGIAEVNVTNNWDVMLGRWVSAPAVAAGNLSGVVSWVIGFKESSASMNAFDHIHIFVTAGDTNTVRGTVLTDNIGATEWPLTATATTEFDKALTSVAVQVGDRVVVEVGYRASNTVTTSFTGTMNYGGAFNTDLFSGDTVVTTLNGYIQFSDPNQVLSAKSPNPKNLCPNPAAGSASVVGWSNTGAGVSTLVATSVSGFSRTTGVKFTIGGATSTAALNTPPIPAGVGEVWSFYIECSKTGSTPINIFFNFHDAAGAFLNNLSSAFTLDTNPQIVSAWNAGAPANTAFVDIDIEPQSGFSFGAGDVISISCIRYDWSLEKLAYLDGDTVGWVWDGTSDFSTSHQVSPSQPDAFMPFFV
jgi:hypothetical protein